METYIKVLNPQPTLVEFLTTDEGHNLFDSLHVQCVVKNEVVLDISLNEYVEIDSLGFINNETNGFTPVIDNYVVEGYAIVNGSNLVFLKEVKL